MKILAFSLIVSTIAAITAFSYQDDGAQGYKVGDVAKTFKLKNSTNINGKLGQEVGLSDLADAKGYIVIFTCNHCPFSVAYENRIISLHNKYAPKGYPVVAVNPNDAKRKPKDSYDNMVKRAEKKGFPFYYLHDESQEIAKAYGATKTPHCYLLEKTSTGNVVKYIGAIDDDSWNPKEVEEVYLDKAVEAVLSGKVPNPAETKAIGCTIKWKGE